VVVWESTRWAAAAMVHGYVQESGPSRAEQLLCRCSSPCAGTVRTGSIVFRAQREFARPEETRRCRPHHGGEASTTFYVDAHSLSPTLTAPAGLVGVGMSKG
jgi:hypothetical protein